MEHVYLVFGANSAIARGVIKELIDTQSPEHQVTIYGFSRGTLPDDLSSYDSELHWITVADYTQQSLSKALTEVQLKHSNLKGAYIFNGILHNEEFMPEKALSQFEANHFEQVIHANTTVPVVIIQQLLANVDKQQSFKIAVLSARIGSIGDNGLGGWHSYRSSKAALNMLLKNVAIECARSYKGIKLISYHPGTTDSPLSKPFQSNVPSEQLFDQRQSARYFLNVVKAQKFDNTLSYVDWQGAAIPW
ncbi:SDR family NAD(P)-dependent oxidoreductase [Psychrosphaera ytuae]|uniref:SDR family NAD(P)-dependent oxidoreductase n=1 Tax=Psychrosphaera ytuae TaxID=2820710 RepID=A0A975DCE7_9GAMM|nr:SDR family NAD(P)-dependent oxidoreductase [Psychrosphaera ytuae]QTH64577.1 SDR family NAD(P)-dependent oxidoreductase [Psychrosphaera ytuae]